jgi:hypothetical protein
MRGKRKRDSMVAIDEAFHFPEAEDDTPPVIDMDAATSWIYPCAFVVACLCVWLRIDLGP